MSTANTTKGPVLTVEGGPLDGESVAITKAVTTIGRLEENDIVTKGPGVSRRHAVIIRSESSHLLSDLSSKNGTFINGRNIGTERQRLQTGDYVRLGQGPISLVFRENDSETAAWPIQIPAASDDDSDREALEDLPPGERTVRYLQSRPEGAEYQALEAVVDVSGPRMATFLARLVEARKIQQRGLRFYAVPEHYCPDHNQQFQERDRDGEVSFEHDTASGPCFEKPFPGGSL